MHDPCAHLFKLRDAELAGALQVQPQEYLPGGLPLLLGETVPSKPLPFEWLMGETPSDLVAAGLPGLYLLSDRFRAVLRDHGFTGWSTYPVTVFDRRDRAIVGYTGLSITGRCGPVDDSRSLQVMRDFPTGRFPVWRGLYLRLEAGDGSDLCFQEETASIIAVERVRRAVEQAGLTNVSFTALSSIERFSLTYPVVPARPPVVAPPDALERYLPILRRALRVLERCGRLEDRDWLVFCGHLADLLHNLPVDLIHWPDFDERAFWRYVLLSRKRFRSGAHRLSYEVLESCEQQWNKIFSPHARPRSPAGRIRDRVGLSWRRTPDTDGIAAPSPHPRGGSAVSAPLRACAPEPVLVRRMNVTHHVLTYVRLYGLRGDQPEAAFWRLLAAANARMVDTLLNWTAAENAATGARLQELEAEVPERFRTDWRRILRGFSW